MNAPQWSGADTERGKYDDRARRLGVVRGDVLRVPVGLERLGGRLPAARGPLLKGAAVPGLLTLVPGTLTPATARPSHESACAELAETLDGLTDVYDDVMSSQE